jgi:hypothetical protein
MAAGRTGGMVSSFMIPLKVGVAIAISFKPLNSPWGGPKHKTGRIWDSTIGQRIRTLPIHAGAVNRGSAAQGTESTSPPLMVARAR